MLVRVTVVVEVGNYTPTVIQETVDCIYSVLSCGYGKDKILRTTGVEFDGDPFDSYDAVPPKL